MEQLRRYGRVSVRDLSEAMNVSAVTIRHDLRVLEDGGLLERTYGGAVSRNADVGLPELSFHTRQKREVAAKAIIAQAAASLIHEGYSIALDASTTAFALVPLLKPLRRLTVLTNSLVIAQSFLDAPDIQVLLPGGRLRRDSISVVGHPEGLPEINLNLAFIGTRGLTVAEGASDVDPDEAIMKQALMARAVQTIVLVDASKWGKIAPYTVLRTEQIGRIITTGEAPLALVREFEAQGVVVEAARSQPVQA